MKVCQSNKNVMYMSCEILVHVLLPQLLFLALISPAAILQSPIAVIALSSACPMPIAVTPARQREPQLHPLRLIIQISLHRRPLLVHQQAEAWAAGISGPLHVPCHAEASCRDVYITCQVHF